jgi:hypothetical protein
VSVFLGREDGTLSAPIDRAAGRLPKAVAIGDFSTERTGHSGLFGYTVKPRILALIGWQMNCSGGFLG